MEPGAHSDRVDSRGPRTGERRLDAVIAAFFGAVMLCVASVVILCYDATPFAHKDYKGGLMIGMLPLAAIVLAVLALTLLIARRRRAVPRRERTGVSMAELALAGALLFALALFIGYNIYALQSGDVYCVVQAGFSLGRGEPQYIYADYFEAYPNNIPLVVMDAMVQRALILMGMEVSFERFTAILMALQCANSALTGVLLMALAAKLTGRRAPALLTLAGYTALIALSGWITVPYSDAAVLSVPALTAVFDLYSRESRGLGRKLMFAALAGAAGGVGMMIKPQGAMVLCAILVCEAAGWVFVRARRNRASVLRFAAVLCAFLAVYGPVRGAMMDASGLDGHSESRVSPLHYLYMGLGESADGGYNGEDYISTEEAPTFEGRQALYWQGILRRVEELGPARLLKMQKKKCLVNFSDGTFAWGINGHEHSEPKNERISPFLRSVFWEDGRYNPVLTVAQQGVWLAVLMLCPFAGLAVMRRRRDGWDAHAVELNVLLVSVLGFAAFSALFESGGRYIFSTAPTMIVVASSGMSALCARGRA